MAEQHRATADQWALIERMRHHGGHPEFSAIIELLHRVEALEAAAKPNYPAKPDGSLVKRVKSRMIESVGYSVTWEEATSSVLIEVAAWLSEQKGYGLGWAAVTLEGEAKR